MRILIALLLLAPLALVADDTRIEFDPPVTREDVTAEALDGTEYTNCNQALLTGPDIGRHQITNRVQFGDGTSLDRSVTLIVADT